MINENNEREIGVIDVPSALQISGRAGRYNTPNPVVSIYIYQLVSFEIQFENFIPDYFK